MVYLFPFTSKFLFLAAIIFFLIRIFNSGNKKDEVLLAAGYIVGFEVFSRMTGGAFSYEFAKYAVILFLSVGMFFKGFNRNSWVYILYLFFLIPGILFSAINLDYETNVGNAVAFNLSGPICLGISALYCYNRKITMARLQEILLAVLLPIISMTLYLYVYTPNIGDVLTGTQSNFAASGGFGPNQVATILGLGMFILFARLFTIKNLFVNSIDVVLLAFLSYRGIVTFSRGGIITAAVCAIAFFVIYFLKSGSKERVALIPNLGIVIVVMFCTWIFISFSTSGLIDKRYANQDASGREKQDITSGRTELLNSELEAFKENPITGIGIGKMKEYRLASTGRLSASHNELSRLLSEHGVFGFFALVILILTPLVLRFKFRNNLYFYSFLIFWFLTINHSSMRIAAPAFIYGLALITLVNAKKNPLHRK